MGRHANSTTESSGEGKDGKVQLTAGPAKTAKVHPNSKQESNQVTKKESSGGDKAQNKPANKILFL